MKTNILILLTLFIMIVGCRDKDQDTEASMPTRGKLIIGIDETLRSFTDAEIEIFSAYYPDSSITPLYLPEKEVVERLLSNEIRTGVICRDLSKEELNFIEDKYGHSATTFKLAYDKIVAAVNQSNPVSTISYNDIKHILSGRVTDWGQLDRSFRKKSPILAVIPRSSSTYRHFYSSAEPNSSIAIYALDTTDEVVDYVKENVSAIGLVSGSWFNKRGNKVPNVKLLAYSEDNLKTENQEQGLTREVYAVTHEPFTGLGNGFISFMAGQKGQLIISKAGMTPYRPIVREIEISGSYF